MDPVPQVELPVAPKEMTVDAATYEKYQAFLKFQAMQEDEKEETKVKKKRRTT